MAESTLSHKLDLKPYTQILLLNCPETFTLEALPEGCSLLTSADEQAVECAYLFALNRAELEQYLPLALEALRQDDVVGEPYTRKIG